MIRALFLTLAVFTLLWMQDLDKQNERIRAEERSLVAENNWNALTALYYAKRMYRVKGDIRSREDYFASLKANLVPATRACISVENKPGAEVTAQDQKTLQMCRYID